MSEYVAYIPDVTKGNGKWKALECKSFRFITSSGWVQIVDKGGVTYIVRDAVLRETPHKEDTEK